MAARRHSTVQFNPTEWLADTARMPRIVRSVLFDLACYSYERAEAVPPSEVFLQTSDLPDGQGEAIISNLISGGHLVRNPDGTVYAPKALDAGIRALTLYEAKARGGRGGKPAGEDLQEPPVMKPEEPTPLPDVGIASPQEIADGWNAMAAPHGYKQVVKMTPERHRRLLERIAEHGPDALLKAIETMPERRREDEAKLTFDAFLKPDTCTEHVIAACGEAGGSQTIEEE